MQDTTNLSALPARRLLGMFLTTLALGGCETIVDLPEPAHTPRIALQYVLSNYTPQSAQTQQYDDVVRMRKLFVSNSQRVFDLSEQHGRADATVVILDETGKIVEQFEPERGGNGYDEGYYKPTLNLKAEPGRTYKLRASLPGFETVESTQTLPAAPVIESVTFTRKPNPNNPYMTKGQLNVTVADDPGQENYYVAFARLTDEQGGLSTAWSQVQVDDEQDEAGLEVDRFRLSNVSSFAYGGYGLYPYADANVNGKRFSLSSNLMYYSGYCSGPGNCQQPTYLEVFVSSITRETYNFYLSRQRYYDTEGNPFAEPAPLASNIKPGYGLFGGFTDAVYRIKIN